MSVARSAGPCANAVVCFPAAVEIGRTALDLADAAAYGGTLRAHDQRDGECAGAINSSTRAV